VKVQPYRVWNRLPHSARTLLRDTRLFDIGERANNWLWRTDWYVHLQYDFTWVTVEVDGIETSLYVPAQERPWWREYARVGCHEPLTSRTFAGAIDNGDTVWDMGSRFGYFSTLAAIANDSPEDVHVFEHSVSNWRVVEENNRARFDGRIHVNEISAGAEGDSESLTEYADDNGAPQVAKMDIEGSELAALRDMEPIVRESNPTLIIEVHPTLIENTGSGTDETLYRILQEHYDDVRMSFDFRSADGKWEPAEALWEGRSDHHELAPGEHDYYQLFCE